MGHGNEGCGDGDGNCGDWDGNCGDGNRGDEAGWNGWGWGSGCVHGSGVFLNRVA